MARRQSCPNLADLRRLLDGPLSGADEAQLTDHLDGCADCRLALDALAGGGQESTGAWLPADLPSLDQALQEAIDSLKALKAEPDLSLGSTDLAPGDEPVVGLLTPVEGTAGIGRLGPYQVTEVLGRGGFGIVFKAFDPALHRYVAIKVLAPQLATSVAARKRFAREARAAAAVSHEHLVSIHGVDEANGLPYIVMEYVSGISLQERLDRDGPLDVKDVLRIGAQTAAGLAAAHAHGLVHRDVKPANILLENGMARVKLTDFGLARAVDDASMTSTGGIAGTPQYMAPEQARGEPLDHRADLFSLGSVLYAMCTGRPPFRASTTLAVLRRVSEDSPRPVRDLNPDVPGWLGLVIAALHEKDPAERFQSASEVADLLSRYLAHLQQPARVPPPPAPARRPAARVWRRRGLAAVLLVAGLGLVGAGWHAGGVRPLSLLIGDRPAAAPAAPAVRPLLCVDGLRGPVLAAAFAPANEVLATAEDNGLLRLCDLDPVRERRVLIGPRTRVWSVAFSPDGRLLASAGGDWNRQNEPGELLLWDATTGDQLHHLRGHGGLIFSVAFSPDGRLLAAAGWDGTVRLWDALTGQARAVLRGHTDRLRFVAFSPDGKTLASGGFDGTVRLWDPETGRQRGVLPAPGHKVNCVAFSRDGKLLATAENPKTGSPLPGGDGPGRIRLWDTATWRQRAELKGPRGMVLAVAFSPDGRTLASGGGSYDRFGEVLLWDVAAGRAFLALHGHKQWVECVAFSPDGRTLVTGGGTSGTGELALWEVGPAATSRPTTRPPVRPAPAPEPMTPGVPAAQPIFEPQGPGAGRVGR
jgi:WD40 repeat protein